MADLASGRFVGHEQLQACLDGSRMTTSGFDRAGNNVPPFEANDREAVEALQEALLDLGFTIGVDGGYGPQTAGAVRQFKIDQGLPLPPGLAAHDGVASKGTLGRLDQIFQHEVIEAIAATMTGTSFDPGVRIGERQPLAEGVASCQFENGIVVELGSFAGFVVPPAIAEFWAAREGATGALGVPNTPPFEYAGRIAQGFSDEVAIADGIETYALPADIFAAASGSFELGAPEGPAAAEPDGVSVASFEDGAVLSSAETPAVALSQEMLQEWGARRAAGEALGAPLAPATIDESGATVLPFAGATLSFPADGGEPTFSAGSSRSFFLPPVPGLKLGPKQTGCDLRHLIGGPAAFQSMVDDIRATAANPATAFVFLSNFNCDLDLELPHPSGPTTLRAELSAVAKLTPNPVQVRALLWAGDWLTHLPVPVQKGLRKLIPGLIGFVERQRANNEKAVHDLSDPAFGADSRGFLDFRYWPFGSVHQKLLIVFDGSRLVAYVGGIDWTDDRLKPVKNGAPLFDVSERLVGRVADQLLATFRDRWKSDPKAGAVPLRSASSPAVSVGNVSAQVTHCYSAGSPFPSPIFTSPTALVNALHLAEEFFYIEEQFFWGSTTAAGIVPPPFPTALQNAMAGALGRNAVGVVVLASEQAITPDFARFFPELQRRRRLFLNPLKTAFPSKLLIFERLGAAGDPKGEGAYVHSKLLIVDDDAALTGSVNCNRRSWGYDAEVTTTLVDEVRGRGDFAPAAARGAIRDVRCRHWEAHLRTPMSGNASTDLARWRTLPASARVRPFDHSGFTLIPLCPDMIWKTVIDPGI